MRAFWKEMQRSHFRGVRYLSVSALFCAAWLGNLPAPLLAASLILAGVILFWRDF